MNNQKSGSWPSPGPLETGEFPDQLKARVVTPGSQPRIHGYDVEVDLAQHYSPCEVALLAVTGELPEPEVGAALAAILVFCSPTSVAYAPTHAAVLARLCGADSSAIISVAAIALAEQAGHLLDEHEEFLQWLKMPGSELPERYRAVDTNDEDAVERLRTALHAAGLRVRELEHELTRDAAILAALHACGLRSRRQYEALLVWTRLPIVVSEAFAERATNFRNYPINLPNYVYQESTP
jgi:hypothetical protein